jgi:soluble lytic murein transglycosylase-like protein
MRSSRSRGPDPANPLIDRAPVKPFDPIARRAAAARSEGQGRSDASRRDHALNTTSDVGSASGRRSLALDGSEHGGRLTARRDGGSCADLLSVAVLSVSIAIALGTSAACAEPQQGPLHNRDGRAGAPSDPWSDHVAESAKRFAIPERWIRAVMQAESAGDMRAVSPKGAMGLMQIMPATWQELRARHSLGNDPFEPRDNILAGTAYLREMLDRFGRSGFLAAYNAGPTRYEEYLAKGRPLPRETVNYVKKLTPIIDGIAPDPSELRQPDDRRSAGWSLIFVQSRRSGNVDPASINREPDVPADTVFAAAGWRNARSPVDGAVTDLTAIEPLPDATSHDVGSTPKPDSSRLFVRRSSISMP